MALVYCQLCQQGFVGEVNKRTLELLPAARSTKADTMIYEANILFQKRAHI